MEVRWIFLNIDSLMVDNRRMAESKTLVLRSFLPGRESRFFLGRICGKRDDERISMNCGLAHL